MSRLSPAQQATRKAVRESRAVRSTPTAAGPRWTKVGTAAQYAKGITIRITEGAHAGLYGIVPSAAPALLMDGQPADLYRIGAAEPEIAGQVSYSESGLMLLVELTGESRYGAYQIPAKHLVSHYIRGDLDEVDIVAPNDQPRMVAGVPA